MIFRIEVVLVADDLSEDAATVVRSAGALASLAEAELHVVHAVDAADHGEGPGPAELHDVRDAVESHLGDVLPDGAEVRTSHVEAGRAHEVILKRAREVGADLIVIGPHRGRRQVLAPLGTTADHLVRTAEVPCLILRRPLSLPLRRILVPTDLSESANRALDLAFIWGAALRMPKSSGETTYLDLVHVMAEAGEAADDGAHAGAESALRSQVEAAAGSLGAFSMLKVETAVLPATDVAETIQRVADEKNVDLLVIGTHGESERTRELVGSVSSAVAQRSERPVLLVPPPVEETEGVT